MMSDRNSELVDKLLASESSALMYETEYRKVLDHCNKLKKRKFLIG